MGQVIYRRAWCPQCRSETVHRVRPPDAAGHDVAHDGGHDVAHDGGHELVVCTECADEVEG